jgi:hypothetical protein
MGYDAHITRKKDWSETTGPEISLDEWVSYVRGDPEMRLDGFAQIENDAGEVFRHESPGIAVWLSYSGHGINGNMAWFCFDAHESGITVKNPDPEILGKMWRIAQSLSAKIQGDDGEAYNERGEPSWGDEPPSVAPQLTSKPWGNLW